MTVSSGRRCFELYGMFSPLGSLVKTLLESSEWNSTTCLLSWKHRVTPAKRLLFQLAPSMPRTGATGYGLLQSPMPSDVDGGRTTKGSRRQGETGIRGQLLRTPRASDADHGGPNQRDKAGNPGLTMQIAMLPTPKGSSAGPDYAKLQRSKTGMSLQTAVGLLPTPQTQGLKTCDENGKTQFFKIPFDFEKDNSEMEAVVNGTNPGLKLQPGFALWMMGYPEDWLDLKDGE